MFIQRLVPFPAVGKEFLFSSLYLSFSLYFLLEATLIWSTQAYLYIKVFNILILSAGFFLYFSASANVCNVILMRNNELSEGIEVVDEDGNVVGTSVVAARKVS